MKDTIKSPIKDPELIRRRHLQIAKRASKLFIRQGYTTTTMREISKATGITVGSLYDYIRKKEDVLCLVFDVFYQIWSEHLEKSGIFAIEDPSLQLTTAVRKMLELVYDYRDMVLLMYRESRHLPKKFLQATLEKESGLVRCFEDILRRGIEKKVFHIKDPFFTANIIVYQLSFSSLRWWNVKHSYTDEQIIDHMVEHILKSVS
jgi:TetR/AcrR family transcriptional regulator, cholesterol catabolism regulator